MEIGYNYVFSKNCRLLIINILNQLKIKENHFELCGYSNEIINEIAKATDCRIQITKLDLNDEGKEGKYNYGNLMIEALKNVSIFMNFN